MDQLYNRITNFNKEGLPDMVKLKYEGMAENVFRFFRGTCHLFYEDLAANDSLPQSPVTWITGDLHIENFGSYKGDNRLVYFDLNDFDESILAPVCWELVRMLTSILIAFDNLGLEKNKAENMARLFLKNYSATLIKGKAISIDPRARGIVCTFLTAVDKRKQKALLKKRTTKRGKLVLSTEHDKHLELDKKLKNELCYHLDNWINTSNESPYNYKVQDVVFRLAGTGSIGVKRYLFLLKSLNKKGKYLLVDMKQMRRSSLQPYIKIQQPQWQNEAERVVCIQQRMENVSPALLGTTLFKGDTYMLQELQPTEDKINFELIKDRYRDIYQVIDDMALLTASAQLRSGGRQGSAITDYLIAFGADTNWHEPVLAYALKYKTKVKTDYKKFLADFKKGKY